MTVLALKDVCKLLGVQPYRIQHAFITGVVPETTLRVSGRRIFDADDIKRLADHFGVKVNTEPVVTAGAAE